MKVQENPMQFYQGQSCTFITPSGNTVTIREQNGDDDEILSRLNPDKKKDTLKNLNTFLSAIIRENTYNNQAYLDQDEVKKLKLKDKYYILFKSRLHSLGSDMKFAASCPNPKCKKETKFKEDLTKFDADLSNYASNGFEYQISPYASGKDLKAQLTLQSGKKLEYTYLNVGAEVILSEMETISNNTDLYIRDLKIYNPITAQYETIGSCNIFSKRDMMEIEAHILSNDPQFMMFMDLQCPHCKVEWEIPFLYSRDFFFPKEI